MSLFRILFGIGVQGRIATYYNLGPPRLCMCLIMLTRAIDPRPSRFTNRFFYIFKS